MTCDLSLFSEKIFISAVRSAYVVPFNSQERRNFRSVLFAGSVIFPIFHDRKLDKLKKVCYSYFIVENCDQVLQEVNDSGKITDTLTV